MRNLFIAAAGITALLSCKQQPTYSTIIRNGLIYDGNGGQKRGELIAGNYADIVIFDPTTITDHATYDKPHQYATGVTDVFVNGVQVLKNGTHTNAKPGRL